MWRPCRNNNSPRGRQDGVIPVEDEEGVLLHVVPRKRLRLRGSSGLFLLTGRRLRRGGLCGLRRIGSGVVRARRRRQTSQRGRRRHAGVGRRGRGRSGSGLLFECTSLAGVVATLLGVVLLLGTAVRRDSVRVDSRGGRHLLATFMYVFFLCFYVSSNKVRSSLRFGFRPK